MGDKQHFSFIKSPRLQAANEDKDCFLSADKTEKVFGGMLKIRKALNDPTNTTHPMSREYHRLQFHISIPADGRLKAREPISRIDIHCENCEKTCARLEREDHVAKNLGQRPVVPSAAGARQFVPLNKKSWNAGTGGWQDTQPKALAAKGTMGMGA